jgi:hypothetical protein
MNLKEKIMENLHYFSTSSRKNKNCKICSERAEEILEIISEELDEKFPSKNFGKLIKHLCE